MKHLFTSIFALAVATAVHAGVITVTVDSTRYQTVTGFGAAACDGAATEPCARLAPTPDP